MSKKKKAKRPPLPLPVLKLSPDELSSVTADLVPRYLQEGLYYPYIFGFNSGQKWIMTASIEAIAEAATRMTTNQQIEGLKYYNKRVAAGQLSADENTTIIFPTQDYFGYEGYINEEISDYFKEIQRMCFYFNYDSEYTDNELNRTSNDFLIFEVPNAHFRKFEDGWTEAVRKHFKCQLLA